MKRLRRLTFAAVTVALVVAANMLMYVVGSLVGFFEYSLGWTISAVVLGGFAVYGAVVGERFRRTLKKAVRPRVG